MLDHPSSHSVSLMSGMIYLLIILTSRSTVSEIHLIRLTCQATWSLANTPIVVFITVIFSSIVAIGKRVNGKSGKAETTIFVVVYYANFVYFFFFYSRAAVNVVFHLAVLFRFYHLLVVVHHVFLSEQIMMMMMKSWDGGTTHEGPFTVDMPCKSIWIFCRSRLKVSLMGVKSEISVFGDLTPNI